LNNKIHTDLDLSIVDAIANLNAIADMAVDLKDNIAIAEDKKLIINNKDFLDKDLSPIFLEDPTDLIENIKKSYKVILSYFLNLYEKEYIAYEDYRCKKGIESIILVATKAANNIDKFLSLIVDNKIDKISESKEYLDLLNFYLEKLKNKFPEEIAGDEAWEKEWADSEKAFLLDFNKSSLNNFDAIKKDLKYELFYMLDEDENLFFDSSLINNIKIFTSFDEMSKENIKEDPLLDIKNLNDKDLKNSAKQILHNSKDFINKYFAIKGFKNIDNPLNDKVNKMLYSLFLASNEINLITNMHYKSSSDYFFDFQKFLREILNSDEYLKNLAYIDSIKEKEILTTMVLISNINKNYFLRKSSIKQEILALIHRLNNLENKKDEKKLSFFSKLIKTNENISKYLEKFPNGPMLKILDVLMEEKTLGFDPSFFENADLNIFNIESNFNEINILKSPSPTNQLIITEAEVVSEFKGFIRSFKKDEKYLIINLQDKSSAYDQERIKAIENLQKKGEFREHLILINFDKDTSFYHQSANYLTLNDANLFLKTFKQKFLDSNPTLQKDQNFLTFFHNLLDFIFTYFFHKKQNLLRRDRLDFIEIAYNFLSLKLLEIYKPKYFSYMCKDFVDKSPIQLSCFYAFLKLIINSHLDKEDEEYIKYLAFSNALLIRDRTVNNLMLLRSFSALNLVDLEFLLKHDKIKKQLSSLYDPSFLKSININHF
jgi:hypothetical protein